MAPLYEGSSVKDSSEDRQASAPYVRGSTLMWGPIFSAKSGLVPGYHGGIRIFSYTRKATFFCRGMRGPGLMLGPHLRFFRVTKFMQ